MDQFTKTIKPNIKSMKLLVLKNLKLNLKTYQYPYQTGLTHFFNLRIMCLCLGRALRRHCDFSKDTYYFLDDLQELENEANFTYKFNSELKITSNGQKIKDRLSSPNSDD